MPLQITQQTVGPHTISSSPASDCWRLVHDTTKVIAFFRSTGITSTRETLFCGTQDECTAEIARLSLTPLPEKTTSASLGSSSLEQARTAKLVQLEAAYQARLAQGITPTGSQITLAAQDNDVAKFSQLVTLLREAEELQPDENAKAAFRESQQTIIDIDGAPHQLSVQTLRAMLVDYGSQVAQLYFTQAAKIAAVKAATTVEAIDAIPL